MTDKKEDDHLAILCENHHLDVYVGKTLVKVHPPTIAQLELAGKYWIELFKKSKEMLATIETDTEKLKEQDVASLAEINLQLVHRQYESLLPICKVYLAPPGEIESSFSIDQLKKGLNTVDIQRLLEFCKRVPQVGDLAKNAIALTDQKELDEIRGQVSSEE